MNRELVLILGAGLWIAAEAMIHRFEDKLEDRSRFVGSAPEDDYSADGSDISALNPTP